MTLLKKAEIERLGKLMQNYGQKIEANAAAISEQANANMDTGIRGIAYDTVKRGGNDASQPERYALSGRHDLLSDLAAEFMHEMRAGVMSGQRAWRLMEKFVIPDQVAARDAASKSLREQRQLGYPRDCVVCGHKAFGGDDDRLRDGRCDPCYQYRHRSLTMADRPKSLWGIEDEAVS